MPGPVATARALGGSGSQEQSSSGYQAIADKQGFIILFPNGIDNAWNIGPCCTSSPDVDDLGFAKGMVAALVAQACIDTKRVYATGFSMGGGMCQSLACNAADMFAAVAPSSLDLLVPDEEPCAPSRPISVLAYRGTADTTVPYAGGLGPNGRITFLGAQCSFQRWATIDGCASATTTDGDCTYQSTCTAGVQIGLCVKQGAVTPPVTRTWAGPFSASSRCPEFGARHEVHTQRPLRSRARLRRRRLGAASATYRALDDD